MENKKYTFHDLIEIIKTLRSENGCPWDKVQTHDSLKKYLIEESYEFIEAVDLGDPEKMADELGDVLLQVMLHSQIGKETSQFDIDDVINALCNKMVIRHPHVFSDVKVDDVAHVFKNWEEIKKKQMNIKSDKEALLSVSKSFPATVRGEKVVSKSTKLGKIAVLEKESIDKLKKLLDNVVELGIDESFVGQVLFETIKLAYQNDVSVDIALNNEIDQFLECITKN